MSYVPSMTQLHGVSVDVAECYGKPHIGCIYASDSVKSHQRKPGAKCCVCGRHATNAHHCPPMGKSRWFTLTTPNGSWLLKPALLAVCGSGTTGCHNGFHGGARFVARWVWEDDQYAQAWWDGRLLNTIEPHSPALYLFGHWEITDRMTGGVIRHDGRD